MTLFLVIQLAYTTLNSTLLNYQKVFITHNNIFLESYNNTKRLHCCKKRCETNKKSAMGIE
jgi:hypothetical protein